ncbi:MAG: sugar ABC transporter substrate-binding protein [Calditrichaceae bacterium]|nr:sugar ABC transporter substrate-binding protein [Calditrichaceae bacterium]
MRNLFLLLIGLGLSALLTGCVKQENKTDTTGKNAALTYWCASNPREIELARRLVDQWNVLNPDSTVHLQPIPSSQSSEEVLLAAIAGGTTPDICSNMWPGAMDDYVTSGGLVRLDKFPDFFEVMRSRVPDDLLYSFIAPDSHFYQIPWKTNPIMIIYNKKMFREAGVTSPLLTYSEFTKAAESITHDKNGDGQIDQWMSYREIKPIWWQRLFDYYCLYIAASGGKTLFKNGQIDFNNEASVKVFAFLQAMYKSGYFPLTEFQGDQFLNERLATQITGPWMVSYIDKYKQENFEYGIMPLPVPDDFKGRTYTYGDHKNIAIFSTTEYPQLAWKFSKTLISKKSDLALLELCSQIPIRLYLTRDSYFNSYFKHNPKIAVFAEQAPYTRGVDGIADLKEILDCISQEYEASVLYHKKAPGQAVSDAADRAKVIMEWNRSR